MPERYTYDLPEALEASEPPEARGLTRDAVRMLVSYRETGTIVPSSFVFLPRFLDPGDLLVINTSGTLPAAIDADGRRRRRPGPPPLHPAGRGPMGRRAASDRRPHHRAVDRPAATPAPPAGRRRVGHARAALRGTGAPVDRHARPRHAHPQLAGGPRPSHPLRLRRSPVAHRDVPERLRHDAGQRRDAECRPAVHPRDHHRRSWPRGSGSPPWCSTPASPRSRPTSSPTRSG